MLKNIYFICIVLVVLVGAFFGGYYMGSSLQSARDFGKSLREMGGGYVYINPLLACAEAKDSDFRELTPLKSDIQKIILRAQQQYEIESASVYFRDPLRGLWMGINEDVIYSPASLLKVPIMMAYFKLAEQDPSILQKKFLYTKSATHTNSLIETPLLISNHWYTIEELIQGMIVDSDNNAVDILQKSIDPTFLSDVYSDLGIISPYGVEDYEISAKTYALFFRVLYNATFLNRDMSEKALELLASVRFSKGLRAGIPSGIVIAHKYGLRVSSGVAGRQVELSDCGIVYDVRQPYIMCVMTKGKDPDVLANFIQKVGAAAHNFQLDI